MSRRVNMEDLSIEAQEQVYSKIIGENNRAKSNLMKEQGLNITLEKESDLQRNTNAYLARLRDAGRIVDYFHLKDARGERAGLPDVLIFCPNNKIIYIELKTSKGKLRPEQKKFRDRCNMLSAIYNVCRTMPEVINVIKTELKELK